MTCSCKVTRVSKVDHRTKLNNGFFSYSLALYTDKVGIVDSERLIYSALLLETLERVRVEVHLYL